MIRESRPYAADKRPEIRQRSIQALVALQAPPSLRQLAKRIRHEDDQSVLASVLRAFIHALDVRRSWRFADSRVEERMTLLVGEGSSTASLLPLSATWTVDPRS